MADMRDVNPVIDGIAGRSLPGTANMATLAMIGVGVVGLGYGFGVAGAAWTWGAILVAIVYTMAVAQGGMMYAVVLTGTWARWGRPLKRIGEALAFFLPFAYLALLVFLVGGLTIYAWHPGTIIEGGQVDLRPHSPEAWASKELWLSPGFFMARHAIGFALLLALDFFYLRASLGPDMAMARERLGDKTPKNFLWNLFGKSSNVDEARTRGIREQSTLVPFIALTYAVVFSGLAFDLLMSLSPWWFSNMFGGWIFMSSFWLGMATMGLVAMLSRDWLKLGDFVTTSVTHDLGKLLLAACMFWAYTTYAQLLPIWYTDMPEETDYLLVRLFLPQWSWLARLVAITCFIAPFTILLSRGVKKMRWPFAGVCVLIMCGLFLERSLLVLPSIYFGDTFPAVDFILCNVFIWIGALGVLGQVVGRVLATVPPLVVSDPYLDTHPWDVHVHSLDAAQH
ncbi:MAG: hypothetical protein ACI8PZ_004375 [Myxococcota bacterium]|jgi:hypothetical protein